MATKFQFNVFNVDGIIGWHTRGDRGPVLKRESAAPLRRILRVMENSVDGYGIAQVLVKNRIGEASD